MKVKRFYGRRNSISTEVLVEYNNSSTERLVNRADNRSPYGFQWGYGGSGPFALAKSILYEICPKYAQMHWLVDAFKWNVIALLSDDEWSLTAEQVENFIARKTANMNI